MPDPQAAPLHVSPQQQDILEHIVRRMTSAQRLVKRSRIILLAITGMPNTQIAQQVQVDHETVRRWRDRWRATEARLQAIEATGKPKLLSQAIEALLADEQRPRAPATFTFLSDPSHRIRFVYTPMHSSWLNQIERWFSILVRRRLARLSCVSVEQLRAQILAFIASYNQTSNGAFRLPLRRASLALLVLCCHRSCDKYKERLAGKSRAWSPDHPCALVTHLSMSLVCSR